MGRRILRYVIIWAALFILLCIIAIVKYRGAIFEGINGVIDELGVGIVCLCGFAALFSSLLRRR